jgi:hypothetical protein
MGIGSIPADRLGFDPDGVVADIMTTFLDTAQERQGPHPFRHEDIITFSLEERLGSDPRIVAELIRELSDRPHPFLEVAGWPDLARLRFEDKGEGGQGSTSS